MPDFFSELFPASWSHQAVPISVIVLCSSQYLLAIFFLLLHACIRSLMKPVKQVRTNTIKICEPRHKQRQLLNSDISTYAVFVGLCSKHSTRAAHCPTLISSCLAVIIISQARAD